MPRMAFPTLNGDDEMSTTKLVRDLLNDKTFERPFINSAERSPYIFERSVSIEDGLKVLEQRDAKMRKKDKRLVTSGKSMYGIEYRIPKGWARSQVFNTLAQAMAFYKAHAFEATQNYRRWAESGLKSNEI